MALIPIEATYNPIDAYALEEEGGLGLEAVAGPAPQLQGVPKPPPSFVGIEESTGTMFVNGFQFDVRDSNSALLSEKELDKPPQQLPAGFRPIAPDEYKSYLDQIDDPSLGRLIKENFGIGVENLKALGGRGLQFLDPVLGTEELGQEIVDEAGVELDFAQPFQRAATDVPDADNPVMAGIEYLIANFAQQGPNLIESALVAIMGAIIGTATGGPVGTAFGAVGALAAKSVGKKGIQDLIESNIAKAARGEVLEASEEKLLSEVAAGAFKAQIKAAKRTRRAVGGASAASLVGNYAFGVADITGEQAESGERDRMMALLKAGPYAALEFLPEFAALGFLTKGVKGGLLRRGFKGLGAGAVTEGTTEAAQELLLLSENLETDAVSAEGIDRLLNSFFAGAGVGGIIGGGGAVLSGKPRDFKQTDTADGTVRIDVDKEKSDLLNPQRELFPDADLGQAPAALSIPASPTERPRIQGELFPGVRPTTPRTDDLRDQAARAVAGAQEEAGFINPLSQPQRAADARGRIEDLGARREVDRRGDPSQRAQGELPFEFADQPSLPLGEPPAPPAPTAPRVPPAPTTIIPPGFGSAGIATPATPATPTATPQAIAAAQEEAIAFEGPAARQELAHQGGERQVARGALTGAPTVTFSAPIGDTGRTATYTLTVAEALENSAQRIQALTDLRACLG